MSFIIISKTFVELTTKILTIRQETGKRTQNSRPGGWYGTAPTTAKILTDMMQSVNFSPSTPTSSSPSPLFSSSLTRLSRSHSTPRKSWKNSTSSWWTIKSLKRTKKIKKSSVSPRGTLRVLTLMAVFRRLN